MTYLEIAKDGTFRLTGATAPDPPVPVDPWPVGSVYISILPTDPSTLFGGTWARMPKGKMLIALNENDPDFDTPLETQGSKTKTLVEANVPPHIHAMNHDHDNVDTNVNGNHTHSPAQLRSGGTAGTQGRGIAASGTAALVDSINTDLQGAHSHVVNIPQFIGNTGNGSGTGTSFDVMNPVVVVYMWRRTS